MIFLLKKCFKIVFFSLASRSGFGATISDAVARSSILLCNSVSADRIVMAASRLLRAVAAFVILLSFAAGSRKSYWSGCMKAATVICQQIFSILALVIFLLKILLKSASKSSFFPTCQVRVVRFYVSCLLSSSPPPQRRPSTHSVLCRTSTTTIHAQCSLPDLNHDHPRPVFPAGPQPRPSTPSVPCRTSTATSRSQWALPDLNGKNMKLLYFELSPP